MSAITIDDLNNAQVDTGHIATIATSAALTATDRLGHTKDTIAGVIAAARAATAAALAALGYGVPAAYAGGISLTLPTQTVSFSGAVYAPVASSLPFTTSGSFSSDAPKFRLIQGIASADLAAPTGAALIGDKAPYAQAVARTQAQRNRDVVHVNDWGGDLRKALTDVGPYTTIFLGVATYDITGLYKTTSGGESWVGNTTPGLRLVGAAMPHLSANGRFLTGGTVIQGTLFNLADDFEVFNLGVDVGVDVVANKYGDVYKEVFCPGINTTYPTPQTTIKNVVVDNVVALGAPPLLNNPASAMHAALFENLEHCRIGYLEAIGGYHGFVCKANDLKADTIVSRGASLGEGCNIKSDPANSTFNIQIGKLKLDSYSLDGVEQKTGALLFNNLGNAAPLSFVNIGQLTIRNQDPASGDVIGVGGTGPITDIVFGSIIADYGTKGGAFVRLGFNSSICQRWNFGSWSIISGGRTFELSGSVQDIHLGTGTISIQGNQNLPCMVLDGGYTHGPIVMRVNAAQTNQYLIQRNAGDVFTDRITFAGTAAIPSSRFFSSAGGSFSLGLAFTASGIPQFGGPGATYKPYRVRLRGAVRAVVAGAGKVIGTVSPAPLVSQRFNVPTQLNSNALGTAYLEINAAGTVTSLGTTTVGDYVFLDQVEFDCLTQ